jgi:hypothetical protein
MHPLAAPLFALLVPLAASAAQAIVAQPSGLSSPGRVVDFGSGQFANGTPITTQFAGLTIAHASYFTTGASNNLAGGFLTNDFSGPPNRLSIRFAQSISDVSFVYHQIGTQNPSVIRALLQGVTVDSFSILWNATSPNNFFGFEQTAMDEIQIDFDGDFNLDTLAFTAIGGAACHYYNGTNVNPAGFGCLTGPVLGGIWQSSVFTTPSTVLTALVHSPAGFAPPVRLFGGELLLSPALPWIAVTGGSTYSVPIPADPSWVGASLHFQAVRLELVGGGLAFVPMNATQIVIGL